MTRLIMYLVESSAVLVLFYLFYVLVLRRETFFSLNRFFLLVSLAFSLLFPLVSFDFNPSGALAVERPVEEISRIRRSYYDAMAQWELESRMAATSLSAEAGATLQRPTTDWAGLLLKALLLVYAVGVVASLSRMFYSLHWLWRLVSDHPVADVDGVRVVKLPYPMAPFSFLRYVFVHSELVGTTEFDQVLAHEKTHIRQRHSVDLIFVQLLAAFFWFNPVVWRLIKSLKTTHEYIADRTILNMGHSLVEYQTLLLKQLISNNSFGLVHNFNLSFIKKRITMMTNKQSGWAGKVKVALTIAGAMALSAIIVQCNSRFEEQQLPVETAAADYSAGIRLTTVPDVLMPFNGEIKTAVHISIAHDIIKVNGAEVKPEALGQTLPQIDRPEQGTVLLWVDVEQPMALVRKVQNELRKADLRKVLYTGKTASGDKFMMPFLLPPILEIAAKTGAPIQPDVEQLEAEGKMDIMKVKVKDNARMAMQTSVFEFVKGHVVQGSTDYVISLKFADTDSFEDYLVNLVHVREGFNRLYQERAMQMFGKNIADATPEEYKAVRQGVPMAISVAE